jgi:predicted TIM-barrel fold metal-dependent hydrolase
MSYRGSVIDCDVHYTLDEPAEIVAYLPREWRDQLEGWDLDVLLGVNGKVASVAEQPLGVARLDTYPDDGSPPGSDYDLMRRQLLDKFAIDAAVLNLGIATPTPNGDLAAALCRANNDWLVDRWLDGAHDPRLYGAMLVPTHDPLVGAKEIRRAGSHSRFAAAMLTRNVGRPFGQEIYHPIFRAAAELDLPIYFHSNGAEIMGHAPPQAGGTPLHYRLELIAVVHQTMATHLTSMIMNGVFERFPNLRVIAAEMGVAWLVWFSLALDANWEIMRRESRWVRRLPSEYLREHVGFSTQPIEAPIDQRRRLLDCLAGVDVVEDMLCFSSDYPHWDGDEPTFIGSILPAAWHQKVFYGNARRLLRLSDLDNNPQVARATS